MRKTRIGSRYAKALFELTLEKDILEKVNKDMGLISNTIKENKDLKILLRSPVIKSYKKESIIKAIFKNKIEDISLHFTLIIIRKNREEYIDSIVEEFKELYKKYKNITTTYLKTAIKIDEDIRKKVIKLLQEQTKGEIELNEIVNKELIGGFVLTYGPYQYDASIAKQIADLKKDFRLNLYIRKF